MNEQVLLFADATKNLVYVTKEKTYDIVFYLLTPALHEILVNNNILLLIKLSHRLLRPRLLLYEKFKFEVFGTL